MTLPNEKGQFPAVVLVSGSGPQDRDETIFGHKPFLVIADQLTRAGFAVLRYDDRGIGGSSGNFNRATSLDFANDARAAIEHLKSHPNIDAKKIGVLGHSEGALIAQIIASETDGVAFIILLAGPGVVGTQVLAQQNYDLRREQYPKNTVEDYQKFFRLAERNGTKTELLNHARVLFPDAENIALIELIKQVQTPWMGYFLRHDPAKYFTKIKCPVLALNGSLDSQVHAQTNIVAIEQALKKVGHHEYEVKILDGLNHLFQTATTGKVDEYARIEETISPTALRLIISWLKSTV